MNTKEQKKYIKWNVSVCFFLSLSWEKSLRNIYIIFVFLFISSSSLELQGGEGTKTKIEEGKTH